MADLAEFQHLALEMRSIARLGPEERIAHIRAERWVRHAAADRILATLQEAFDQPPRLRRENVLLLGESGMGKSMLIEKFARANAVAPNEASGTRRRPVLVISAPPTPTEAELFECILDAVNAPVAGHGMRGLQLRSVTIRLLRELGVRVLVIDEINSVLAGTPRQQRLFLQLLRFLSNELGVALVCAGIPEARHALLSDPQLRSRFSDAELAPWTQDDELRDFVNRLVWSLPLREPSPVDSLRVRALLAERSDGVTLGICKAIERAAVVAIRSGRERLDIASFDDPEVWRGVATTGRARRSQGRPRGAAAA